MLKRLGFKLRLKDYMFIIYKQYYLFVIYQRFFQTNRIGNKYGKKGKFMVLILDGKSNHVTQAGRKKGLFGGKLAINVFLSIYLSIYFSNTITMGKIKMKLKKK